ncbi:hypothetical protein C9374_008062 [Naegleria lovaniensis]|uniref:Uncharacterized protein n=1 Tax=Naegleria lovaniensis TaxID=51637 RepID=A0AA88KLH4_NAELO|nr:uncharacterized protein C9374_012761 [Naegleria lovaniensis]XP_044546176.1 uncharacterized protein C9374_008062 [Naegleria lovaniensis]KAG2373159.1 hypothetical protein C9374_012761 [Naegleria lovaniensis]KAG2378914.1 hypothetical protein C9374_008062 [Naegleria lovaniensis]
MTITTDDVHESSTVGLNKKQKQLFDLVKPYLFIFEMICAFEVILLVFVLLSAITTFFDSLPKLNKQDHECSSNSIYYIILSMGIMGLVELILLASTFQLSTLEEKPLLKNEIRKTAGSGITNFFTLACFVTRLALIIASTSIIEAPACSKTTIYTTDLHYFVICMWLFWSFSALLMIPKLYAFVKSRNITREFYKHRDATNSLDVHLTDDEEELLTNK